MLDCIMCISNVGSIERGKIAGRSLYSIDKVILKMASGKRLTRYAVCINGCWNSNQQMTLREARDMVSRLKKDAEEATYYAMGI